MFNIFGNQSQQSNTSPFQLNSALQKSIGTGNQLYGGGTPQTGDFTMGGQGVADANNSPWGNMGLEQMGKGIGIAGDLFGMYNQYQAMQMAKDQLGMQKTAYNNNATNQQNFNNGVIDVFGSGQQKMNNQLV